MQDESRISDDQRYRLLTETLTDCAFIMLDAENRITDWSDGAEHLFGYMRAEVLNREVRILHTPEDCESGELERDMQTALRDGRSQEERWHVCKDGRRFWGVSHRIAARSSSGELLGYATAIRDLTARVQAEQQAEQREQLHSFLLTLGDRLSEAESGEEVIRIGVEMIGRQIRASGVWHGEVNAGDAEVKIRAAWEDEHAKRPEANGAGYLSSSLSESYGENKSWVISDVETDGRSLVRRMLPAYRARGVRATVGIPIHRDGNRRAVLVVESAHPRPWTSAEIELVRYATHRMITALERRRSAEKIQHGENLLQRLLEIETVGILFFRPAGDIIRANQAFLRMTGYTQGDIQVGGMNLDQLTPSEWKPTLRRGLEQLKTSGSTFPYEREYHRMDGSRRWALCAAVALGEDEIMEFLLDITERKEMEQELRASEHHFESLVNLVPELLWSTDATGMESWCNQRWTEYTGQSPEETHFLEWLNVIHPEDRESSKEAFLDSLQTGRPWRHEHRLRRKDGEYRWFLVQAVPIRSETDQVVQWFGSVTDVHEQRLAMDARGMDLEKQQKELQWTTAQLMRAQEEASRQLARDLHDSINQQLAVMGLDLAHLRTQLGESTQGFEGLIAQVERQASALAEEVRLLSHRLHPSALDDLGLAPALQILTREFERAHGMAIVLDLKGLTRQASRPISTALYRIAQEALQNVAKHARTAQVLVTAFEKNGEIHLVVEDNGPGFDRSQVPLGLGLISMQERGHLVGGELHLNSSIGRGTTVHFVAPFA